MTDSLTHFHTHSEFLKLIHTHSQCSSFTEHVRVSVITTFWKLILKVESE